MANIEEVLQRGEALSGTGNGRYLTPGSLLPWSAGWAEHARGKGLLIPEPPEKGRGLSGCFSWTSCDLKHLAGDFG